MSPDVVGCTDEGGEVLVLESDGLFEGLGSGFW